MTSSITLSHNELKALLSRTFEALYGHKRDYSDMADCVLWLECHGHDGVAELIEALPVLEKQNLIIPKITHQSDGHYIVDCRGHSLFVVGKSLCDLAISYVIEGEEVSLDIVNAFHSKSLLHGLNYIASRCFSSILITKSNISVMPLGTQYPTIYIGKNDDIISLVCAKTDENLNKYLYDNIPVAIDVITQRKTYSSNLESGIKIDKSHYEHLTLMSNKVLVEASEMSRRGAGE